MSIPRFAAAVLAVLTLGGVWSGSALAARQDSLAFTLGSPHFLVHYESDVSAPDAITETQAGDVAAIAERAYAAELAAGYPAPPSDGGLGGDGRIDIYVTSFGQEGLLGATEWDAASSPTTSYILLDSEQGLTRHTIGHELFHVIQLGIWFPAQLSDYWLLEGSAEWMGYMVDGYDAPGGLDLGNWDMSLQCRDPIGTNQCDLFDTYKNNGYSRWPFFEYLSQRWGTAFVKDVFTQGAAGAGSAIAAVSAAISAKGTTLTDVFDDWTIANLTGSYTAPALHGLLPAAYSETSTRTENGQLPTQTVAVNHLAARYLAFKRGDGSDSACYKAKLNITVTIPTGIDARPYFYWPDTAPVPLAVSGSTATLTNQDWDTCAWPYSGYLVLQNPSLTADARDFKVDGSIIVDKTTPATASVPPLPVPVSGPVVPAPATDPAPTLTIHAPEVLRVSAKTRLLRFVVYSSGEGTLEATLGDATLGKKTLRTGNNDLRFVLPKSVFSSLRSTASADTLSLTSLSLQGTVGTTITRQVVVQKPPKKPRKH